jgi:hypothetical protein
MKASHIVGIGAFAGLVLVAYLLLRRKRPAAVVENHYYEQPSGGYVAQVHHSGHLGHSSGVEIEFGSSDEQQPVYVVEGHDNYPDYGNPGYVVNGSEEDLNFNDGTNEVESFDVEAEYGDPYADEGEDIQEPETEGFSFNDGVEPEDVNFDDGF